MQCCRTGSLARQTLTPVLDITALVALNWIYGRPMRSLQWEICFHFVKIVWKPLLSSSCLSEDVFRPHIKLIARYTHLTPVTQSDSNDAKELLVGITSPVKGDSISILMMEIWWRDWTYYLQRYDGVCDKDGCDFNSWRMGDIASLICDQSCHHSKDIYILR